MEQNPKDDFDIQQYFDKKHKKQETLKLFYERKADLKFLQDEILKQLELDDLETLKLGNNRNWNQFYEGLVNLIFCLSNKEKFVKIYALHFEKECNFCQNPESDFILFYHRFYGKLSKKYICWNCIKNKIDEIKNELFPFFLIYSKLFKAHLPSEFLPKQSYFSALDNSGKNFEIEISFKSKQSSISIPHYFDTKNELKQFLQERYTEFKKMIDIFEFEQEKEKEIEERIKRKYHIK